MVVDLDASGLLKIRKYFRGISDAFVSVSAQARYTEYPTITVVGRALGTMGHILKVRVFSLILLVLNVWSSPSFIHGN